ncbi:hypothetical protein BH23ACT3_BH23ACT3_05930 [soil metagenome]
MPQSPSPVHIVPPPTGRIRHARAINFRAGRVLALGAVAVALASCAGDDDGVADEPQVVEVTAVDFGFEGLPDSVPAGTRFTLANTAPSELHEIVAFRLPDDEERSGEQLMQLPPEQLGALFAGEPATVLLTPPGGDQIAAVGDGTLSEPGRYLLICAIPTGVAPEAYLAAAAESQGGPPQIDGGPPHFLHGMWTELTVT